MKKLAVYRIFRLLSWLALPGLWGCQELSIDSQASGPLKLATDAQDEYVLLAEAPRDVVFSISSNTPWEIRSDRNWCIPSPGLSAASSLVAEITVRTEKNETEEERTAVLTITADGIDSVRTVTIRQDAKSKLRVQPVDGMLERAGGGKSFTVCSNKAWTVTSSDLWLTFDKTEGAGTGLVETVQASAAPNDGTRRTAVVTVKNGLEEVLFEVVQDGVVLEPEEPLEGPVALPAAGGSAALVIRANIEWTAEPLDDWLQAEIGENGELRVTGGFNPLFAARTGKVILKPKKNVAGLDGYELEFTQARNVQINGSETVHADGSATLEGGSSTNRYSTNMPLKLGKITWNFSEFAVGPGGVWFDVNGWPDEGTANFHLWLYESSCELTSSGAGFGGWDGIYPGFTAGEIAGIRRLAIEVAPDELNPGKLKIVLYVNDQEKGCMRNRENAYADPSEKGQVVYFGFPDAQPGCRCTIESFTMETYE